MAKVTVNTEENKVTVLSEGKTKTVTVKAADQNRIIKVLTPGAGYTTVSVTLVGGNGTSQNVAKASGILGDGKVRSFNVGIKWLILLGFFEQVNTFGFIGFF